MQSSLFCYFRLSARIFEKTRRTFQVNADNELHSNEKIHRLMEVLSEQQTSAFRQRAQQAAPTAYNSCVKKLSRIVTALKRLGKRNVLTSKK